MNTTDYSMFHKIVEQFCSDISMAAICRHENAECKRGLSWNWRKDLSRICRTVSAPGVVEVVVSDAAAVAAIETPGKTDAGMELGNGPLPGLKGMKADTRLKLTINQELCYV